jgi:hypothetical protein
MGDFDRQRLKLFILGLSPNRGRADHTLTSSALLAEELMRVRDEMVDQYLEGELAGAELEAFERGLNWDRVLAEQVQFGKLLRKYIERNSRIS